MTTSNDRPDPPELKSGEQMDRDFRGDLNNLINQHSRENSSNTPDFILAEYLGDCLDAYDKAVRRRTAWYEPKSPRLLGAEIRKLGLTGEGEGLY